MSVNNDTFSWHRSGMYPIAYRMLGTRADAEDTVQDTWLRWNGVDERNIACADRLSIANLYQAIMRKYAAGAAYRLAMVNGAPGLLPYTGLRSSPTSPHPIRVMMNTQPYNSISLQRKSRNWGSSSQRSMPGTC